MGKFKPNDIKSIPEVKERKRNMFTPKEPEVTHFVRKDMLMTKHLMESVDQWRAQNLLYAKTPAIVTADWHLPFLNEEVVDRALNLARELEDGSFIIAGDFFNYDRFSKWPSSGLEVDWLDEKIAAREVFKSLMEIQKKVGFTIYWFGGNHEARIWHLLGAREDFATIVDQVVDLGKTKKFVLYTNFEYLYLFPEPLRYEIERGLRKLEDLSMREREKCWMVCHPMNYSRIPARTPRAIANIEDMNVICGHAHHLALNYSENGVYKGIDCGCMTEPSRNPYIAVKKGTHPKWNPGFAVVDKEGKGGIIGRGLV